MLILCRIIQEFRVQFSNDFLFTCTDWDACINFQRQRPVKGWLHGLRAAQTWRRREEGNV